MQTPYNITAILKDEIYKEVESGMCDCIVCVCVCLFMLFYSSGSILCQDWGEKAHFWFNQVDILLPNIYI